LTLALGAAVGDPTMWRRLIVPQHPFIGKRQVVLDEVTAAAAKATQDSVLWHMMTANAQTHPCPEGMRKVIFGAYALAF